MGSCSSLQANKPASAIKVRETNHQQIVPESQNTCPPQPQKDETLIINGSNTTTTKIVQPSHPAEQKATFMDHHTTTFSQIDPPSSVPKVDLRMSRDTYEYLLDLANKSGETQHISHSLIQCFETDDILLLIPEHRDFYKYENSLTKLLCETFTKMCYATKIEEKKRWRTRLFNILEIFCSTHTGEKIFEEIRNTAGELKRDFPVTEKDSKGSKNQNIKEIVNIQDFDDVVQKKIDLTSFFPFTKEDLVYNEEDYLFEFQEGKNLAIPTECKAVKRVLACAHELKEEYSRTIELILASNGGEHFKCGSKSYLRTEAKLHELVAQNKERPVFRHLFDSLRCKAHFTKPEDIQKAYNEISSKFQIIRVKNKLHTALHNMTFNLVYKDIISEIQLVLGMPQAESENHILYEIERTRSMPELYQVVEGWGGYDFSEFQSFKGDVIEITKPSSKEKWVTIGDTKYRLLKSKEYIAQYSSGGGTKVTFFDESQHFNKQLKIRCFGETRYSFGTIRAGFCVSMCQDFELPKRVKPPSFYNQEEEWKPPIEYFSLNDDDDVILKVEGFLEQNYKSCIEGLRLHSKKGQVIELGLINDDQQVEFVFEAPHNGYIVGFGGQMNLEGFRLIGLYCWVVAQEEKIKVGYQEELKNGGVPHGKGIMVYPDGSQYNGEWNNNKKHGKGVLTNSKGELVYDGTWLDDMKHGKGLYCYAPDEWYSGNWKNDKRDGMGQYSSSDQNCHYYGSWKNDKLNGRGTLYSLEGECKQVIWEDNYAKNVTLLDTSLQSFKYFGGVVFDLTKKFIMPHGHGVFENDQIKGFGVADWDHGKGKGYYLTTDHKRAKYEGELLNFFPSEKGIWYYLGGKLEGHYRAPTGGKCQYANGAILEGGVQKNWRFYATTAANNDIKPTNIVLNTSLLQWFDRIDSYYDVESNSLYCFRDDTIIRFEGKAIDFKTEGGQGTWYLRDGEKVTGDWIVEGRNFIFDQGLIEYPNGNVYTGKFEVDFLRVSMITFIEGTLSYKNGTKFEGVWEYEKFVKGTILYSNGDKFIGSPKWKSWDGEFHCLDGKTYIKDPPKYKISDKVITYGKDLERYELYCDDINALGQNISVKGTCFYLNGDRYEGEISLQYLMLDGKGTLEELNGSKFEGLWVKDKKKTGKCFLPNGLVLNQEWRDDFLRTCCIDSEETYEVIQN